jgi:5-methylcytosine-specific restriction endonuclease McrA
MKCDYCGTSFDGRKRRFCEKRCQLDAAYFRKHGKRRGEESKTCKNCGKTFIVFARGRPRVHCSNTCSRAYSAMRTAENQKQKFPRREVICRYCKTLFVSPLKRAAYCNAECRKADVPRVQKELREQWLKTRPKTKVWTCNWCKGDMVVDVSYLGTRAYHDECRVEARVEQNRRKNAKRRGARWAKGRTFHREIAERDNFICHICNEPVDMSLPRTHRFGATVDHVVPLAKGGTDDPENLKLAHWICNTRKSDKLEFANA